MSVDAVLVVGDDTRGTFARQDLGDGADDAVERGPHQRALGRTIRGHSRVAEAKRHDPVDPQGLGCTSGLSRTDCRERVGARAIGDCAELSSGREHDHRAHLALVQQPKRAAGEDRLVVGVGVQEDGRGTWWGHDVGGRSVVFVVDEVDRCRQGADETRRSQRRLEELVCGVVAIG